MSGMLFFHCINTALLHEHMVPTSCKHPFDHSCTVAVWTLTTAALWLYDLWPQLRLKVLHWSNHNHLAVILRWLAYTEHWMSLLTLWISLAHCEYRFHWYTLIQHWYQNQWTRCISQLLLCMGALRHITKVCCQNYAHSIRADCILRIQVGNLDTKWLFYIIQRE